MHRTGIVGITLLAFCGCQKREFNATPTETARTDSRTYIPVGDWFHPGEGAWAGRLRLPSPDQRRPDGGVWFEAYSAPKGMEVPAEPLWLSIDVADGLAKMYFDRTKNIIDYAKGGDAIRTAREKGNILPDRVAGWNPAVSPLETLAGARPPEAVNVINGTPTADTMEVILPYGKLRDGQLHTHREPIQIIGREVALVTFVSEPSGERIRVRHWGGTGFDGAEEEVGFVPTSRKNAPSPTPDIAGISRSPLNPGGWYVFGEHVGGRFVIRALEPRSLLDLREDKRIVGYDEGEGYILDKLFRKEPEKKGWGWSVRFDANPGAVWNVGDRALVLHVFGAVEGQNGDNPAIVTPLGRKKFYTGHFSFGGARVFKEPFTGEPRFDVDYRQVYANNPEQIVSGAMKWHNYMGSLERGWMMIRPVADAIVRHPAFSRSFDFGGGKLFDARDELLLELDIMTARFRTGDGKGVALVTPWSSCVQDSNQAVYIALRRFQSWLDKDPTAKAWLQSNYQQPEGKRLRSLMVLANAYRSTIGEIAGFRDDWNAAVTSPLAIQTQPVPTLENFKRAVETRRTMLPPSAFYDLSTLMLRNNADVWILRSSQVGGALPNISPAAPGWN